MKHIIKIATALISFALIGCNEFARDIVRLDGEFPLALSVQFVEPDFAPGDTVTIRTCWGGEVIDPSKLIWDVAWKFTEDPYDNSVAIGRESLNPYIVEDIKIVDSTASTQIFEMKIEIPKNIIRESPYLEDDWSGVFDEFGIDFNPAQYPISTNKDDLLDMLDSLVGVSENIKALISLVDGYRINGLCQLMTVKFRIYCDNRASGGFEGYFDHSVRYNSKLAAIPGVFVNKRPEIKGSRIHVVHGDHKTYDISSGSADTVIEINNNAFEFEFDNSKSYFLENDISERDTTITIQEAFTTQHRSFEEFYSKWFYDSDAYDAVGMIQQADKTDRDKGISRMVHRMNFGDNPETDKPMVFHLVSNDGRFGVSHRPDASDLQEFTITLR